MGFVDAITGKEIVPPNMMPTNKGYLAIDKKGKEIVPFGKYGEISNFHNGLALVEINNKGWGIIDKTGREIVAPGGTYQIEGQRARETIVITEQLKAVSTAYKNITKPKEKRSIKMNKRFLSVLLAMIMVVTLSISAFAAQSSSTQTVTFNAYATDDKDFADNPVTVSVTNVTVQKTQDFSTYLSDDKTTIAGKNSKVIYCNAPVTVTLQPNAGEKHCGMASFGLSYDSNKVPVKSVQTKFMYYVFNTKAYAFDFSKKLTAQPAGYCGYADGSSQVLTKAGTYVASVRPMNAIDDSDVDLTPVFIVVGGASTTSVTAISLNKTTATLAVGATVTLTASISPNNAASKAVAWTSSNTKVATVDAKGKVTAKAKGTATITCNAANGSGKTAACKVTVK